MANYYQKKIEELRRERTEFIEACNNKTLRIHELEDKVRTLASQNATFQGAMEARDKQMKDELEYAHRRADRATAAAYRAKRVAKFALRVTAEE